MTKITYNQGETAILDSFFRNEPPTFGPFYVGLGTGGAIVNEAITLADLNELSGQNYSRLPVNRDSSPAGWAIHGDYVQSPQLFFTNTDPVNNWEAVDYAFLTLSQSGTQEPNILIAAAEFPNSLVVKPEQRLYVTFKFRQTTNALKSERISYGVGNLIGLASVSAVAEVS